MQIIVIGSGGWGTALALLLLRNGHAVTLWSHCAEAVSYTHLISWTSKACRQRVMDCTEKNVRAFLDGVPVNVVNQ